jgi:hypothetical protein
MIVIGGEYMRKYDIMWLGFALEQLPKEKD